MDTLLAYASQTVGFGAIEGAVRTIVRAHAEDGGLAFPGVYPSAPPDHYRRD